MMANETSSTDITNQLFTALVDFDNVTQQFGPELAKSWEVAPDGMTWTFHLRKGAAFSDGHPITAEDVLFSFQVALRPSSAPVDPGPAEDRAGKNFKVSAPDPYTVVIKTPASRTPRCSTRCATGGLPIMPKHVLEPAFKDGSFASAYNVSTPPDKIVTSGPWRLAQYVPARKPCSAAIPYYYGVRPEQPAPAVPERAGLSDRARSGRGRSEIPLGRARRRSTT